MNITNYRRYCERFPASKFRKKENYYKWIVCMLPLYADLENKILGYVMDLEQKESLEKSLNCILKYPRIHLYYGRWMMYLRNEDEDTNECIFHLLRNMYESDYIAANNDERYIREKIKMFMYLFDMEREDRREIDYMFSNAMEDDFVLKPMNGVKIRINKYL